MYEGRDLVRGSSGGALYVKPSNYLIGLHIEAVTENEFNAEDSNVQMTPNDKRVDSEDAPYPALPPEKKQKISDSETIASVSLGSNGLGRALIICKFKRLLHYLGECEK
jgi:hypothetical protein